MVKLVNNAHRSAIAAPKQTVDPGEVDYFIVWYNDGTWKRVRDASSEQNVFYTLPVKKNVQDGLMVFCYKSGTINEVEFKTFKKGANLNALMKKPGFNPNETPLRIFLVNTNQFIAIYSSDKHGEERVKVHRVTDINPTGSARNQGSSIIPKDEKILDFKLVSAEHEKKLGELLYSKTKTRESGVPVNSVAYQNEIDFVNSL